MKSDFLGRRISLDTASIQVSSHYHIEGGYGKKNIFDGINNTDAEHCQCCFTTDGTEKGWIEIYLQEPELVSEITVLGRSDAGLYNSISIC